MKIPSVLSITRRELISFWSLFWIFFVGAFYIFLTLFLLNYRFVIATLSGNFPMQDKMGVFFSLLLGLFTAFSPLDAIIVIVSALLFGINMFLVGRTIYAIEHSGKLKLSIGGATIIGLVSAGCSSCGFSILSILGLSTSLSFIPFHGLSLHVLSVAFLLFSSWYMLKKLRDSMYCKR